MSAPEELFSLQLRAAGLPEAMREYRFHETRRWRVDFAWPALRLAVEIEGGTWTGGRHTRGAGFEADSEKYNTLAEMGWTLLRYVPRQIRTGLALDQVERVIAARASA